METRIVFHIEDLQLEQMLRSAIETDAHLSVVPVLRSEDVSSFHKDWVYIIDTSALECHWVREMRNWPSRHVLLIVPPGRRPNYAHLAWRFGIETLVERSAIEASSDLKVALFSELLRIA